MAARSVLVSFVVLSSATLQVSLAWAQIVTGQVVDSISGTPVGTGFVVLLDEENREVARSLSEGDGLFRLAAPAPGFYRLRSERIGYQAFTSSAFELVEGQTAERNLSVLAQAIVLAAVRVQGEDRCNANPSEAVETGIVWQEIRKALAATVWDGTQELAHYRTYGYRRNWDTNRRELRSEEGTVAEGYAGQPYSSIPLVRLLREGFIFENTDGIWYNLPDAGVLQADSFLAVHCFRVVRDSIERPGQIGLAFEPMSDRGVPDVRGALWLDEETSELRLMDVGYTQLPQGLEDDRVGGTVEFLMLPSGAWIVHRWQLRTPTIRAFTGGIREDRARSRRTAIVGFNDTGGEVLEITTPDGASIYPPGLARLSGTVYDSSRAKPLAGATVAIEDTPFWGTSDAVGSFYLTVPHAGHFVATLFHPAMDSIGQPMLRLPIRLSPDETATISFDIPHAHSVARRICSYEAAVPETATIVGLVRNGNSGRPADGREVRAFWQILSSEGDHFALQQVERVVSTDSSGTYTLCGVPLGHPVTVSSTGARPANLIFPRREGGNLLFARDRDPNDPYRRSFRAGHRTWKVDFLLTGVSSQDPPPGSPLVMSGYVTDHSTGRPLGGVSIVLGTDDSTVTRNDGTFDIAALQPSQGDISVSVREAGFQPWTHSIRLLGDVPHVEVSIQLRR